MADFTIDVDPYPVDYAGNRLERACIPWRGPIDKNGYGKVYVGLVDGKKKWMLPHRVAYEQHVGPIPSGYQIDHLCQHRDCVEPTHLEAVTASENIRRSRGWVDGKCPRGHVQPEMGKCQTCMRERKTRWQAAKWRKDTILRDQQRARRARLRVSA